MKRATLSILQIVIFILLLSVLITMLNMLGVPNPFYNPFSRPVALPRPVTPAPGELGSDEKATIDVFKRMSPSVAFITNSALRSNLLSLNIMEIQRGSGSGFIWDQQGHVITNYHVIEEADSIDVTLFDHSVWRAHVVGADAGTDIAVLRIGAPESKLQPVLIGSYRELEVGQKVLAIGNPFGLDSTLTVGIISALGRTIVSMNRQTIYDVIQTDAAINPGNSGGPLLDSYGRLIGVNTAIISPSGYNAGIGFAVPIDTVNRVVPQLISKGAVARPFLGVQLLSPHQMKLLGWEGAVIGSIIPNTAADEAKLLGSSLEGGRPRRGDRIIQINDKEINDNETLLKELDKFNPGDTIEMVIDRDGDILNKKVELGIRPNFRLE